MKFSNSEVLLSFMSFKVLKGILKREKEFQWLSKEVSKSYKTINSIVERGSENNWTEVKIKKAIQEVVFSEPFTSLLFFNKQVSSENEAISESYNYLKSAYFMYVKRPQVTPEFNIYKYLKYVEGSDLYNSSNFELRKAIHKYKNVNYNNGNIEISTLVILSYLEKHYKNYYL